LLESKVLFFKSDNFYVVLCVDLCPPFSVAQLLSQLCNFVVLGLYVYKRHFIGGYERSHLLLQSKKVVDVLYAVLFNCLSYCHFGVLLEALSELVRVAILEILVWIYLNVVAVSSCKTQLVSISAW